MAKYFAMEPHELSRIVALHNDLDRVKSEATRKEKQELTAIIKSEIENGGSLFYVAGGDAHIPIIGQLSEKPSLSASLFGSDQTTYGSIIDNIKAAVADPDVEKIIFDIDSPGGTVDGVDQTAMAIRAIEKPTEAHVHNMAASAAYWLASQTDRIIALTPSAQFGSIGIAVETVDFSKAEEQKGIKTHVITSTDAPDKRPDLATKSGRDKIIAMLDDVHDVFANRVAEGRGVSRKKVDSDFGQGGMVIAAKALSAGMIDGVQETTKTVTTDGNTQVVAGEDISDDADRDKFSGQQASSTPAKGAGKNRQEVMEMTREELKADNPALYNEIFEAGVSQERDRVSAHLTLGKNSGAMEFAMSCITDGKNLTDQAVTAEYLSAGMNQRDLGNREADDTGDTSVVDADADGAVFAAELSNQLGLEEAV